MSDEDAAIEKLERAVTRLEAALARLSDAANGAAPRELAAENRRLNDALDSAAKRRKDLEDRLNDVSGRLDGAIGALRAVLDGGP